MKNLAVSLIMLLLTACASTPITKPAPVTDSPKTNSSSATTNNSTTSAVNNADIEAKRLAAAKLASEKLAAQQLAATISSIEKQSIYFDFDKSELKSEYRDVIQQQASFLNAHRNDVVTIGGNCDERGSDEYNLALGDRRAHTAQKSLEFLGVLSNQIKTVSFGSEKPRKTCHEEECWKENRRDDFNHKLN